MAARGGGHHKITEYDYHDYTNEAIESKTFIRYKEGIAYDLVWSFDRSMPGEVLRTEIRYDPDGNINWQATSTFIPTDESFGLVQTEAYDVTQSPPVVSETIMFDPPVVILTDSMVPGIAWASGGEMNSTYSGVNYFIDKREVVGVESITVPFGSFDDCLKVHALSRKGPSFQTDFQLNWICPNIGLVKRIGARGTVMFELSNVTYNQ
jgi:hypothetical protein